MRQVNITEKGKFYLAYFTTPVVKIIIIFQQTKEPVNDPQAVQEHTVYYRLNRWKDGVWIEEVSELPRVSVINLYAHSTLSNEITLFELNGDEFNQHIVTSII